MHDQQATHDSNYHTKHASKSVNEYLIGASFGYIGRLNGDLDEVDLEVNLDVKHATNDDRIWSLLEPFTVWSNQHN